MTGAAAPVRGAKVQVRCRCGQLFTARAADRRRGWAKYCSKRCKAVEQARRTGWAGPGSGSRPGGRAARRADGTLLHYDCCTCGAPAVNGVHLPGGEIEWGCSLHHSTAHPFSSEAHGQWE